MNTKPKGIHATFAVDCRCGSEFTVTNGRHDPHDCRPRPLPLKVWAEPEEVAGWQEIRRGILKRLEEQMDSPDCPVNK